jgi:hypothetical protein
MAQTQTLRGSRIHPAHRQASAASGGGSSHSRRWGTRLWTLLHARSVLDRTAGRPYDVAFIEDDYRRLAGEQVSRRETRG